MPLSCLALRLFLQERYLNVTKTLAEKIAVMQAAERGEQIEFKYRSTIDKNWRIDYSPDWEFNWFLFDYRVVKKPIKLTRYFVVGPEEIPVSLPFTNKDQAERAKKFLNSQTQNKQFRVVAFEMTEIEANQNDTTS